MNRKAKNDKLNTFACNLNEHSFLYIKVGERSLRYLPLVSKLRLVYG